MSQNVVNYGSDPNGAQLLDDLLALDQQNRLTSDSGTSRPNYALIGTRWIEKTSDVLWKLKMFNGTDDIVLCTFNPQADSTTTVAKALLASGAEGALATTLASKAPLNSPVFTGLPTTPTPASDATGLEVVNAEWVLNKAGGGSLPLLSPVWSDHTLNNASYLLSNTFSWQDGNVYTSAYDHLVADIEGKTPQAETIDGVAITYYLADDGHKIVLPDQESNVLALYNNTGVAWYYILDVANERFKLPRTKYGFVGDRGNVGKYVPESLPNITGMIGNIDTAYGGTQTGCIANEEVASGYGIIGSADRKTSNKSNINASRSSLTYQDNAPVQQRATEMYLYFYVGNFTQSAIEQTAGLNAELFNAKANIGLDNVDNTNNAAANNLNLKGIRTVIETYVVGADWYRIWSDGWIEQGGIVVPTLGTTQFLKPYSSLSYTVMLTPSRTDASQQITAWVLINSRTTTSFDFAATPTFTANVFWRAEGY